MDDPILSTMSKTKPCMSVLVMLKNAERNKAKQAGGPEHLATIGGSQRVKRIGASEIYKATGPPGARREILLRKINLGDDLSGLRPILHGNIYENVTRKIAEMTFACEIHVPVGGYYPSSMANDYVSCSADGLGTVSLPQEQLAYLAKNYSASTVADLALKGRVRDYTRHVEMTYEQILERGTEEVPIGFEFKSPYSSLLRSGDKPPAQYSFQALAMLSIYEGLWGGILFRADIKEAPIDLDFTRRYKRNFVEIDPDNAPEEVRKDSRAPRPSPLAISLYDEPPEIVGYKYFFDMGDNGLTNTPMWEFSVQDHHPVTLLRYGTDYNSFTGAIFRKIDGEIKVDFEAPDCLPKETNERLMEIILTTEVKVEADMRKVHDQFLEALQGTRVFAFCAWKVMSIQAHMYRRVDGFTQVYRADCEEIIKAAEEYNIEDYPDLKAYAMAVFPPR